LVGQVVGLAEPGLLGQRAEPGAHRLLVGQRDPVAGVLGVGELGGVIDLDDITTARGAEMLLPIWLRLWGALQTPMFNFKVVR
jgi:hypothetical protein